MSLAVVNLGTPSAGIVGSSLLADLNLTSTQSAQIEQILAELQSGMISPVEARAQIASVATSQPSSGSATPAQSTPAATAAHQAGPPLTQYYELPLPQESLHGAVSSYDAKGAASETVFSSAKAVNASA